MRSGMGRVSGVHTSTGSADGAVRSGSGEGRTHLDERFPVAGVLAVSWLTRLLIVAARSLQPTLARSGSLATSETAAFERNGFLF